MKLFVTTLLALLNELSHASTIPKRSKTKTRNLTEDCTIVVVADTRIENELSDENRGVSFVCVVDAADMEGVSNMSFPITLSTTQYEQMNDLLSRGGIVSNESTLKRTNGISFIDSTLTLPPLGIQESSLGNAEQKERKHPVGKKHVLVVRVIDSNGLVHPHDAKTMGDNIFGTHGDQVNLKSQLSACSFGKLKVAHFYSADIKKHLAAPGVIEVQIPISIKSNDRYTIQNAVTRAVQIKLGFSLPGPFEYVMYIVEGCYGSNTCGWAAYAYVNSWLSVYQGGYYALTGVQMHELGHNFGLAHSGKLDGSAYSDHTCMMGNPLYSDDTGKMCFNPAKNWSLTWYDLGKSTVDVTRAKINHVETIVGIANYDERGQRKVIIKLETGTNTDYFIGFNRATGVNADNVEADDEVTIVEAGSNGEYYHQSWLKATLRQGESWLIDNDITITAEEIDITSFPGTAKVSINNGVSIGEKWQILVHRNDMRARKRRLDVHDLKFYSNNDCTGTNHNDGRVISSNIASNFSVPERAFDTDINSYWLGRPDPLGLPRVWIGMEFDTPVDINCVSYVQDLYFGASSVEVQRMKRGSKRFKTLRKVDLGDDSEQYPNGYFRHTITLERTGAPTCSAKSKGVCLKQGCIYRKNKCEPCGVLKKETHCFKNGCVWDKGKCESCNDATKNLPCQNKGCVWKTSGCSSCRMLVREKECAKNKCAWKQQKCVPCVEFKYHSVCRNLKCKWDDNKGCSARSKSALFPR